MIGAVTFMCAELRALLGEADLLTNGVWYCTSLKGVKLKIAGIRPLSFLAHMAAIFFSIYRYTRG